jgi:phenylpyruvate tautomerase PptA (4-oxalocrotonate tautomerase family)
MLNVELPVGREVLSSAPTLMRNLNVFQPALRPEETIMPFARIDLLKGKPAEYRATVADVVYQGIVGVLKAPDGDRFIVISEHSPDNLIYDPHFLGWDRSPDFILIQVTSTVGNNKDSKLAFFRYVADELKSKLSVRPDDVMINMVFVDRSDWSFGNGEPREIGGRVPDCAQTFRKVPVPGLSTKPKLSVPIIPCISSYLPCNSPVTIRAPASP